MDIAIWKVALAIIFCITLGLLISFVSCWSSRKKYKFEVFSLHEENASLKEINVALKRQADLANIDGLTSLPNRMAYENILHRVISALPVDKKDEQRDSNKDSVQCPLKRSVVVMIGDLDYFKQVNDKYGHPMGDEVLKIVSAAFKEAVRETDFVGRIGGEEFAFVFENTSEEFVVSMAEKILESVSSLTFSIPELKVTSSIGIAYAHTQDEAKSVYERADKALYTAKHKGRNQVVLSESETK